MRQSCHFGGVWTNPHSEDSCSDPEKSPVWSLAKNERAKAVVTLLKKPIFSVPERNSPQVQGQLESLLLILIWRWTDGREEEVHLQPLQIPPVTPIPKRSNWMNHTSS